MRTSIRNWSRLRELGVQMYKRQGTVDLKRTIKELRQTLKDCTLRISSQKKEISNLKKRLAFYEKRHYGVEIDPLRHNTMESIDKFFATVEDASPYVAFGQALRLVLEEHRVCLNGKSILDWGVGPGLALLEIVGSSQPRSLTGFDTSEVALSTPGRFFPKGASKAKTSTKRPRRGLTSSSVPRP